MRRQTLFAVLALSACARQLAPVPLTPVSGEAQLARGRYLAEAVMACGACHAERDWTFVGGPAKDGTEFAGSGDLARSEGFSDKFSFSAPNLTPHHLGDWTDGELARAIVFGQGKDGRGLFPYMPYFDYRDALARDDLSALVAWLRTLPSKPWQAPGPRRFPMPGFVLDGFPEARTLREKAPQPGDADYGRYLAELAGCRACHTRSDKRGKALGAPYAGGRDIPAPAPGQGTLRSSNLTPHPAGLAAWTKDVFIARFRAGALPVVASGPSSTMPWWALARMRDEDLAAIYDFLRTLPPSETP